MCVGVLLAVTAFAQEYDLLLKGGHVLDARNAINAVRDVVVAAALIWYIK
jgi:dihydroorotase